MHNSRRHLSGGKKCGGSKSLIARLLWGNRLKRSSDVHILCKKHLKLESPVGKEGRSQRNAATTALKLISQNQTLQGPLPNDVFRVSCARNKLSLEWPFQAHCTLNIDSTYCAQGKS